MRRLARWVVKVYTFEEMPAMTERAAAERLRPPPSGVVKRVPRRPPLRALARRRASAGLVALRHQAAQRWRDEPESHDVC